MEWRGKRGDGTASVFTKRELRQEREGEQKWKEG